jgi:hypothetical protein
MGKTLSLIAFQECRPELRGRQFVGKVNTLLRICVKLPLTPRGLEPYKWIASILNLCEYIVIYFCVKCPSCQVTAYHPRYQD